MINVSTLSHIIFCTKQLFKEKTYYTCQENDQTAKESMWHSEDDIIKDLASLNDFGVRGDTEPYKVLYSNGRGSKLIHKSQLSNSFVDHRTGETINLSEFTHKTQNNDFKASRGRGSALGKLARKNSQLQNQLRLARPLGSSDQIIEAYCRRNLPATNKEDTQPSTSETFTKENSEVHKISSTKFLKDFEKTKKRVKATRSSSSQSNALLSSLLSKVEMTSDSYCHITNSVFKNDEKSSFESDCEPTLDKPVNSVECNSGVSDIFHASVKNFDETQNEMNFDDDNSNVLGPKIFELKKRVNESSRNLNSNIFTNLLSSSDSFLSKVITPESKAFVVNMKDFPALTKN